MTVEPDRRYTMGLADSQESTERSEQKTNVLRRALSMLDIDKINVAREGASNIDYPAGTQARPPRLNLG